MWFELRLVSCDFKNINLRVASSFFATCKVILPFAILFCELEIKLRVASCYFGVASCFLRVANLMK